jgi:hypothetical protein
LVAVGALVGVVLTQLWSTKRENVRWERERADRLDQWEREDRARWESEKRAAYSRALAHTEEWLDLARRAKPLPILGKRGMSREEVELLRQAEEEVNKGIAEVALLAPAEMAAEAQKLLALIHAFSWNWSDLVQNLTPRTDRVIEERATDAIERCVHAVQGLRTAMRRDLGVEPGHK